MSADPPISKNKDRIMRIGIGAGLFLFSITLVLLFINEQHYEPVWEGMTCDAMIDWSGTDAHHNMQTTGHNAFHQYYSDHCGGMIEMEMIKSNMDSIDSKYIERNGTNWIVNNDSGGAE